MQQTPIFLQLSFIALQSMQSLCLILLDFKEVLVIIVVTLSLLSDPYNIWSIEALQDLCNRTRNVCFLLGYKSKHPVCGRSCINTSFLSNGTV